MSKQRRANPKKRKHDRKMNAKRMAERRKDPEFRKASNKATNEIYHRNREYEAFMVDLKETQGI